MSCLKYEHIQIQFSQDNTPRGLNPTATTVYSYRQLLCVSVGGMLVGFIAFSLYHGKSQYPVTLIHFSASRWTDLSEVTVIFNLCINPSFIEDIFRPRQANARCHASYSQSSKMNQTDMLGNYKPIRLSFHFFKHIVASLPHVTELSSYYIQSPPYPFLHFYNLTYHQLYSFS